MSAPGIDKATRGRQKRQTPFVLWFTGLSGAGKSTIAGLMERRLVERGHHVYVLDGDNIRLGLTRDLGFSMADRTENIRRVAEVARLMTDAGLIVIVAFISPLRSDRSVARALMPAGEFVEVFIDTPLAVAEERDPKGLYKRARRGELKDFTGMDSPYEPPERPELRVETTRATPDEAVAQIVGYLVGAGLLEQR